MSSFGKGEVWRVDLGNEHYQVLVISSDMFNLDSGLGHLLAMEVRDQPGPYSFRIPGEQGWHVWPAHLDSTPKTGVRAAHGIGQPGDPVRSSHPAVL